jgi:hypothetical protein
VKIFLLLLIPSISFAQIDAKLMGAIAKVESNCGKYVVGDDGKSFGPWQVQLATARDYGFKGNAEQLKEPITNLIYAYTHMVKLLQIHRSQNIALAAFNCGSGCVRRLGRNYNHKRNKYVLKVNAALFNDTYCRKIVSI